jgi:predicted Fe-Mo cluster-binding NifX family protein
MKIVVSAQGDTLEAPVSPVFGRCPTYVFVDTETMAYEAVANPAMSQGGGAGIQAAQFVVERGAQAVLSGNLGPNAFDVLQAATVPSYLLSAGTVRQSVEAFKDGRLPAMGGANVAAHSGMGGGMGGGMGSGMGRGRSMGTGRGVGRGMGRGLGRGRGRGLGPSTAMDPSMPGSTPPPPVTEPVAPESELASLRAQLASLQQQLAETLNRMDELEDNE